MYATGVRVSEVVRLRWRDVDFETRTIRIWQGKGRKDRVVLLPTSFETLLKTLSARFEPGDYLFPSQQRRDRHLSPRTVARIMQRQAPTPLARSAACKSTCGWRPIRRPSGQ